MTDIPHFDLPFRFLGGSAVVVQQDSLRDVQNCCEAVIRTIRGERQMLPDFGITDPTFDPLPVDLNRLQNEVEQWEPRAHLLLSEDTAILDRIFERISVQITEEQRNA